MSLLSAPRWSAMLAVCVFSCGVQAQDRASESFFEAKVRPVLATHCYGCHGESKQQAGLRVDHGDHLLLGGESGPALVPGDPAASRLIRAIAYDDVHLSMPPKGRLPEEAIEALTRWVRDGAVWPKEPLPSSAPKKEVFDREARRRAHWAWSPLTRPVIPEVKTLGWSKDPVDRFLLARLEAAGLTPQRRADKATLLRRVTFALTGLPPTPEAVESFLSDDRSDAFARVVDALLESPAFGEHWARHWLDLVRYCESYGHEFDYDIPYPHEYRDYVIRAFNADVPYDQFVREHLAGDLLKEPRRNPTEDFNESVIGTGFWFFGQSTHAPVDIRQDEADRVDNQIDVMSKTFLGLTVACARCHDHKFDAIGADDYYAFAGYLQSSRRQIATLDPGRKIEHAQAELRVTEDAVRAAWAAAPPPANLAAGFLAASDLRDLVTSPPITFEGEKLKRFGDVRGVLSRQPVGRGFTEEHHLWWREGKPGDVLGFVIARDEDGACEIFVNMTRAKDYGIVQWSLDGKDVVGPIDLFAPNVSPTGPVSLGVHSLKKGEHRLAVRLVGANKEAIPSFMFGLDTVTLTSKSDVDEETRSARVREIAKARGVDQNEALAWLSLLSDPALDDRDHPLHTLKTVAFATDDAARQKIIAGLTEDAQKRLDAAPKTNSKTFETFDGRDAFERWRVTGHAFGSGPTAARDVDLQSGSFLDPGVAHSGRFARRLVGALRSETFVIPEGGLHYRVAGEGGQIRVIIDSYVMDVYNALLFGGISFDVNTGGAFRWHHQRGDIEKFVGHRAYIEILDEGDGFVAVDEIRFGPPPKTASNRAFETALYSDLKEHTLPAVARGLEQLLAWPSESALAGDALARTTLLRHGILAKPKGAADAEAVARKITESLPSPRRVLAMTDGTGEDEYVFVRGDHRKRGPYVPRRNLVALSGEDQPAPRTGSGRLEWAERLLDRTNPLPSRVLVNRVWHHLFGRGIVPTTDDFGKLGQPPSHPELLDHLACWFSEENGWSIKGLIRRIVLTEAYAMTSTKDDLEAERKDPDNRLLHRRDLTRLTGETLRDALLAVSGRLDRTQFGPSVRVHLTPFMQGRGRPAGGPVDGEGRRSVYLAVRRNFLSPFFLAFDAPQPATTIGARGTSNVPAQALSLMNSELVTTLANHWATRIVATENDTKSRIERMYLEAFARTPTPREFDAAAAFLKQRRSLESDVSDVVAFADLGHALFNVKTFYFIP